MATSVPLNKLCAICHIQLPKYTCPRCSTRSCSLQCIKRHKKIAQCSGKRDVAVFQRKSQLTTSVGFDHDYNYLTGLERSLERADRENEQRGVTIVQPFELDKRIANRLNELQIDLRLMPRGMSRAQVSDLRWKHKAKGIRWTVEWVLPDGSRKIGGSLDNKPLKHSFMEIATATEFQQRKRKRKSYDHSVAQEMRDRRVLEMEQEYSTNADNDEKLKTILQANVLDGAGGNDIKVPRGDLPVKVDPSEERTTFPEMIIKQEPDDTSSFQDETSLQSTTVSHIKYESEGEKSSVDIQTEPSEQCRYADLHFYLHRPFTSASTKVVTPVSLTSELSDVLRGRQVLEFPTIYVLFETAEELPEGFELESDYEEKSGKSASRDEKDLAESAVKEEPASNKAKTECGHIIKGEEALSSWSW